MEDGLGEGKALHQQAKKKKKRSKNQYLIKTGVQVDL
jgi:hypothetical protein